MIGGGGATLVTSKAAPEMCPASHAGPTAASSTRPRRAVLINKGLLLIAANSEKLIVLGVCVLSGQCSVMMSA